MLEVKVGLEATVINPVRRNKSIGLTSTIRWILYNKMVFRMYGKYFFTRVRIHITILCQLHFAQLLRLFRIIEVFRHEQCLTCRFSASMLNILLMDGGVVEGRTSALDGQHEKWKHHNKAEKRTERSHFQQSCKRRWTRLLCVKQLPREMTGVSLRFLFCFEQRGSARNDKLWMGVNS